MSLCLRCNLIPLTGGMMDLSGLSFMVCLTQNSILFCLFSLPSLTGLTGESMVALGCVGGCGFADQVVE